MKYILLVILFMSSLATPVLAARGFHTTDGVASTDVVTTTHATNNTNTSWCIWAWRTGNTGTTQNLIDKDGAGAGIRAFYYDEGGGVDMYLQVGWSVQDGAWSINEPSASAWHQICITYNGSSTANAPVIYVDGSSVTVTLFQAAIGTLDTSSVAYTFGNNAAGTRVWNGRVAEFAVWEGTILTSGNVTTLWNSGAGLPANSSVLGIAPTTYWPLCAKSSPEPNSIPGASTGVLTGTLARVHPFGNCSNNRLLMGAG